MYEWVDGDRRMEAFCVTVVRDVPVAEVVARFGGEPSTATEAIFEDAMNGVPDPTSILVGELGPGVVVAENNGWWGVDQALAAAVSRGGRLASCYRSVNADMALVHAVDGSLRAAFDPLLDAVPAALEEAAAGLDFGADAVGAPSFALIERLTGIRVEREWLLDRPRTRIDVPSPF
jgi:hypothetical protein